MGCCRSIPIQEDALTPDNEAAQNAPVGQFLEYHRARGEAMAAKERQRNADRIKERMENQARQMRCDDEEKALLEQRKKRKEEESGNGLFFSFSLNFDVGRGAKKRKPCTGI